MLLPQGRSPKGNAPSDNLEQPGESTPTVFAPSDPTQQDLEWPQVLADCLVRLISAWRETMQCRHGIPSLPRPVTVLGQASTTAAGDQQKGSMYYTNNSGPPKSDHHNHLGAHHYWHTCGVVSPNVTPTNNSRAGDPHDICVDHCPGDPEMPHTSISDDTNVNDTVLTDTADHPGHSNDRQSSIPLTTWPTQPGSPPDEDIMLKRVADGWRYPYHAGNSTDIISNVTHHVTQSEVNHQHDTTTSHTATTVIGTILESPTVTNQPITSSRHRAGRDKSNTTGTQSKASKETLDNPAGPPVITVPIALAYNNNALSPMTPTHTNYNQGDDNNNNSNSNNVDDHNHNDDDDDDDNHNTNTISHTTAPADITTSQISNMNAQLEKLIYNLYHTLTHKNKIVQSIPDHHSITKFRPMFTAATPEEVDAYIELVVAPMIQCIHNHYDKLENDIHQQMLDSILQTHQSIRTHRPEWDSQLLLVTQVIQLFHRLHNSHSNSSSGNNNSNSTDDGPQSQQQ